MLRSSSLLVVLVAGLALSLDLEAIQRSAHFPANPASSSSHAGQQHHWGSSANKRASVPRRLPEEGPVVATGGSPEERLYYRLLSARMARLLPTLLGEQQGGYSSGQAAMVPAFFDGDDDDGSSASHASGVQGEDASGDEAGDEQEADEVMMYLPKRRVIHSPADTRRKLPRQPSFAGMDSGPVYGVRKRVPAMKRRLRIQVAREEKRKRSTRRQLKDFSLPTEASPLQRSKVLKTFGKKKTTSATKDRTKPSRSSHKPDKGTSAGKLGNSTAVHKVAGSKVDGKATGGTSAGNTEGRKYHIMKRSSDSTDENVTGELRNIFGDDDDDDEEKKRSEKKTLKKRENTAVSLKGSDAADDGGGGNEGSSTLSAKDGAPHTSDEDNFKKWLLDEYYRTMALSFASMRRKRMATHRDTLDLRQVKRTAAPPSVVPVSGAADEQFEAVEDKLRNIEDAMIAEAVALVRDGASDEAELRAINAGVASRLDAAYDLENVRQSLDHLQGTLETIRQQELQAALSDDDESVQKGHSAVTADQAGDEDVEEMAQGSSWAQLTDKRRAASAPASKRQEEVLPESTGCPAVEMVSSSCPAAVLSVSPVPALQQMLLDACQWHQICYVCGSYYGLSPEDCESGIGGSGSSQFTRLLVSELLLRQGKHGTSQTACGEPCVAEFLLNH